MWFKVHIFKLEKGIPQYLTWLDCNGANEQEARSHAQALIDSRERYIIGLDHYTKFVFGPQTDFIGWTRRDASL